MLYGGGIGFAQLAEYAALARELDWHLQFLIDVRALAPMAARIVELLRDDVPFVVDHMGHFSTDVVAPDDPAFDTLVALVRDGGWVKLSGAYRLSHRGAPWADTVDYAHRLVDAAPSRCLWGSDWPHVAHFDPPMMHVGDLLDTFATWVPDPAVRTRILVDNPARLYGFTQ